MSSKCSSVPILSVAVGGSGGFLESAVLKSSLLSGGLLGASFGLIFGLFFARRHKSWCRTDLGFGFLFLTLGY
jgi:hypothetical protein